MGLNKEKMMKKLITLLLIALIPFVVTGMAQADDIAISSGEKTATEQIHTGESKITAVEIFLG